MIGVFETLFSVFVGSYAVVAVYAALRSDRLIFQPPAGGYDSSLPELTRICSDDGVELAALHLKHPAARRTLLFFHGNSEDLSDIRPQLEGLRELGLSVFAPDYRGYGLSAGTPREAAFFQDAMAAFVHVRDACGVAPRDIIVYGRSLGGGPAVWLASRERVGGLILEGAFLSTFRVITQWPLFPGDRFRNSAAIGRVACPVLIVHGTADAVVPFRHGRILYERIRSLKRRLWVENAGHNDLIAVAGPAYWRAVAEFCRSCPGSPEPQGQ